MMFSNAFATDPLARAVARDALARQLDRNFPGAERQFFYLPFEHSEDPADQEIAVALMSDRMRDDEHVLHARAHREVIRRFGRFPFIDSINQGQLKCARRHLVSTCFTIPNELGYGIC